MSLYTRNPSLASFTTSERLGMDDVAQSFFEWLAQEDRERQKKYQNYREYYNGEQEVMLTERQKEFLELKPHHDFSANYCMLVVDEIARRLNMRGFDAGSQGGSEGALWNWWQWGRMDVHQKNVHSSAIRDGDTYLIVGWDNVTGRPKYHPNLAYDGFEGVKVHYNDETNEIDYASKKWNVTDNRDGDVGYKRRINLYYPDRIERYISNDRLNDGQWSKYDEDGQPWLIPWVDRKNNPLGVPVIHFKYNSAGWRWGQSVLENVIPIQNALNKAVVDLIAAADTTGFRVYWVTGGSPTDENGDPIKVSPGVMLAGPETSSFGYFPGEPLRSLIEVVDTFKVTIAQISETPLHLFQVSGQNASEGAQKQQEVGMISRAEDTAVHFGNAWEDTMYLSRRLHNAFSNEPPMDEAQLISSLWKDFEVRDRIERIKTQGEALESFTTAGGDYEAVARYVGVDEESAKAMAKFALIPLEYEKLNKQQEQFNGPNQTTQQE